MSKEPLTPAETIAFLTEQAVARGDRWRLKVHRKKHPGALAECIAILDDAEVIHIANPELWLPRLCGGGIFSLSAFHMDAPTAPVGGAVQVSIQGEERSINQTLLLAKDWQGPKTLQFPKAYNDPQPPGSAYSIPAAAPQFTASPSTAPQLVPGALGSGVPPSLREDPRIEAALSAIAAERERLTAREREFADAQRKLEMENLRREHDVRMRELETRVALGAGGKPEGASVEKIIAAVAPIVQGILAQQNEMRMMMLKLEADRSARSETMMQTLLTRPPIDPVVQSILDKKNNAEGPMVVHMVEAMSTMSRSMMDVMGAAADMGLGGKAEDPPALKAIREGVKALNSLMQGYQSHVQQQALEAAGKRRAPPGARPYPAPRPLPTGQPQPQQAPARAPHPAPAPGPSPTAHGPAVNGAPAHGQVPVTTHVDVRLTEPGGATPAGPTQPSDAAGGGVLEQLQAAIKSYQHPPMVAQMFMEALAHEEMQRALHEVDGSVNELVARWLGDWLMAEPGNQFYLRDVMLEVNKLGEAAGIFEDGPEDEEGAEDEGEDDDGDRGDDGEEEYAAITEVPTPAPALPSPGPAR